MSTTEPATEPRPITWRETDGGYEFHIPGEGVLAVPYDALPADQVKAFAAGIKMMPCLEARPRNVIEAVARCIAEMPPVGKDQLMGREGDSQSYRYRSIEAISGHASTLFGKYCVVPKVHKTRRSVKEYTVRSGGLWTEDYLQVKYRIYGPGGVDDYITTGWFHALARDNSDKGTNKALTQARKQLLLDLLQVGDNKDDPDSYSPVGDQPERVADSDDKPVSIEEWSAANGWDSNEERLAAARAARAALKAEVDAGRVTAEQANELWQIYKRPPREALEGGEGPRTKTEHAAWLAEHLPPQTPPQASERPAEPGTLPLAAESPSTAETPPEAPPEPLEANLAGPRPLPEDNGYRDRLDERLETGDVDMLIAELSQTGADAIVKALQARGDRMQGSHPNVDSLRRRLVSLIVRNKTTAAPAADSEPPEKASRRAVKGQPQA